jgi:thioredoxin reductase (NADPH)
MLRRKPAGVTRDNGSVENGSDASEQVLDVVIIGAGPVGLACAIEARHAGLVARVLDKGALVNSIVGYPARMEFFSTPDLIEIGGHPFPVQGYKPTREEGIEYYRGVTAREQVDVRLYETVRAVHGSRGDFRVETSRGVHRSRNVIVATGFFDLPNRLGVPGEELPKLTHYYREPYPYVQQRVIVIGARNSAAKAALDCYRHGAEVTMVVRAPALSDTVKYWIRPDLENRIKEGSIRALFESTVEEIRADVVLVRTPGGSIAVPNDFVLAMTGYRPDFAFLESLGLTFADDGFRTPIFDETTFESARPGVYLAGTVCGGLKTNRWFIENGRFHARQIAKHLAGQRTEPIPFASIHWKTEE